MPESFIDPLVSAQKDRGPKAPVRLDGRFLPLTVILG
jgi:hypothetical protein